MQIFYDAQGKLTTQSEVGSTLNSNSSKLLWLFLLPARMKKIQLKMKALEWSQQCYIIHQSIRCSRAANSLKGDGILTKFKLICAFIVVLLICKNEYDLFKFESTRGSQHFSHYKSMGIFSEAQGQLTQSPRSDLAEF